MESSVKMVRKYADSRYFILDNRLCQACCQFGIIGWLKDNQLVCDYCHNNMEYGSID